MVSETSLAFDHPQARSEATAERPLDRISLRDHVVEVEIGAFQTERGVTQRLSFNVVVEVSPASDVDDDVDRILSYDRVAEAIAEELEETRLNLLETLADNVAARILRAPQAERVFVRIEKLDRGNGKLGVEIVRAREDAGEAAKAPLPVVVWLGNAALEDERLSHWIDGLVGWDQPVILCVDCPDIDPPRAETATAQARIDLLAVEQQAWVLAGRDPRCVVVETLTELDWGMKNGQLSVWAPSKIVLDSADAPEGSARYVADLMAWFAERMNARDFIAFGEEAPGAHALKLDAEILPWQ